MPAAAVFKEVSSADTIGNAYFSLAVHCLPRGWDDLHVVTSEFHMPRSRRIFEWLCGLAGASFGRRYALTFHAVPDEGAMPPEVLAARAAREAQSLRNLEETIEKIPDFAAACHWLHTEHKVGGRAHRRPAAPPRRRGGLTPRGSATPWRASTRSAGRPTRTTSPSAATEPPRRAARVGGGGRGL